MLRNAISKAVGVNARRCCQVQAQRLMCTSLPEDVNYVVLQGMLSGDVRVRTDARGQQLIQCRLRTEKMSDMVNRRFAEWHAIYVFSHSVEAQAAAKECARGDYVRVEGSISTLKKENERGFTLIKADNFKLIKKMPVYQQPEGESREEGGMRGEGGTRGEGGMRGEDGTHGEDGTYRGQY